MQIHSNKQPHLRRRYQKGSLILNKKKNRWFGRWSEYELVDNRVFRIYKWQLLGTLEEFPTRELAQQVLERKIARADCIMTRPLTAIRFRTLVELWQESILPTLKSSNQIAVKSILRNWALPRFGHFYLSTIDGYEIQSFINSIPCRTKTIKNIVGTMRIIWRAGLRWNYAQHDPFEQLRYAPQEPRSQRYFTLAEMKQIIKIATEPFRTIFWLAAETGARAGELLGLCVNDIDFTSGIITIRRSSWRSELREPKTKTGIRSFQLSEDLLANISLFVKTWVANPKCLLFATRNGTPIEGSLILKRKLYPMLERLGILRGGFHAFRHGNSTMLDRLGTPIKLRQHRLGHADAAFMLATYTHISTEDEHKLVQQLGSCLNPDSGS